MLSLLSYVIGSLSHAITVEFCDCISLTCYHCWVLWLYLFHMQSLLSYVTVSLSHAVTVKLCDCISFTCCHCWIMWLDLLHMPSLLSSVTVSLSHAVTVELCDWISFTYHHYCSALWLNLQYFTGCHCWVLCLDLFHMPSLLHSSFIGWVEHFGTKPSLLDMQIHDVTDKHCTHTSV